MASWETKQLQSLRLESLLSKSLNANTLRLVPAPVLNCSLAPPSETVFEENNSESVSAAADNRVKVPCQSLCVCADGRHTGERQRCWAEREGQEMSACLVVAVPPLKHCNIDRVSLSAQARVGDAVFTGCHAFMLKLVLTLDVGTPRRDAMVNKQRQWRRRWPALLCCAKRPFVLIKILLCRLSLRQRLCTAV